MERLGASFDKGTCQKKETSSTQHRWSVPWHSSWSRHMKPSRWMDVKTHTHTRKLNLALPRSSLLIIYKSLNNNINYGDTVYDQPNNWSLSEKIESMK